MPGAIFKYLVLPLQHVAPLDILRNQANVERQEFNLFVSKILLFNLWILLICNLRICDLRTLASFCKLKTSQSLQEHSFYLRKNFCI